MERKPVKTTKNGSKKILGVEFAPVKLPWERRYQTICVVIWFILFFILTFATYPLFAYLMLLSNYKTISWILIVPYLAWIWVIDAETPHRGARKQEWFRKLRIWKGYNDYFPIKLVKTCELNPNRNYLLGAHPHGVLCSGVFGCFSTDAQNVKDVFPGISFHVLTLELNFRWPIARDFFLMFGSCAASRKGMNYLLSKEGGGVGAVLIPGGAPESLDCHPGSFVVLIKNRKGFIKVAIQNGACVVPVITFGETEIYDQPPNPRGSRWRKVQEALLSKLKYAPVPFRGRGIFQYSFGVLPNRRPLTVVVGAPIQVVKEQNPSVETISEIHQKYVDALVELFYKHREKYALDPNQVITIV